MIIFHEVKLTDKPRIDEMLRASAQRNCELSFSNLYIWQRTYGTTIAFVDDMLLAKNVKRGSFFTPVGPGDLKKAVERLVDFAKQEDCEARFTCVDERGMEQIRALFGDAFTYEHSRDSDDYIYSQQDLATLAGRAFHAKRNHVNRFKATYRWSYEPVTRENIPECLEVSHEWCMRNGVCEDHDVQNEKCAVKAYFEGFEQMGGRGGLLRVEGKPVAFTAGAPQYEGSDTFVVHFEKALADYNGVYATINQLFVENTLGDFAFVNREEDMGLEGLRKAKLSYNPVLLLPKYTVTHVG